MQKKKLLLLSAIVLLMGTNSYGTLYPDQDNQTDPMKDEKITQEMINKHLKSNTIVSVQNGKYAEILNEVNIDITNTNPNVNKKVINIASGNSGLTTTNNGVLKATNSSGKGIEIVSIQSGNFINNGTISINGIGGKGISITGANSRTENKGTIEVNGGASGVVINNDSTSFINNKTGKIIAIGENTKGIEITKGEAINNGTIEAKDGALGIYVNGGNVKNSGKIIASGLNTDGIRIEKGNFTTDENSVIEVKGSDKLTSSKSEASGVKVNGTSNFVNNGIIKVIGTSDGAYSGYQSKGININSATATAENKGIILVERNGIGVGTKGKFTNNGGIKVNGSGIGINVIDSGNVTNNEIIEADGKSYGIQVSAKGTATSKGTIIVKNGSTGITTSKADGNTTSYTNIINEGVIEVSGDSSTGMQANDNRKVVNNGDILVNAGKFTSGMKAYGKNALAENNKNLTIIGDGTNTSNGMIAQNGGKVVNGKDGVVIASGKTTSAMSASGKASVAENNGKIELYNNAIGMKIEKDGIGINNGSIVGIGKGVTLNSGIFINSGIIDITGNDIESTKDTNNTVYLKNGSKINGKIVGNSGIDVLALEGNENGTKGEYSNLDVSGYEAISVRNGDVSISESTISLEYNKGIGKYLDKSNTELDKIEGIPKENNGNLTMKDSNLIIDFKDSLTNPNATENPIIDAGSLTFDGNTSFVFNSSDGRTEFDVNEALGIENINTDNMQLESTAVWDYSITDGKITAKKQNYIDVITKPQLNEFVEALEEVRKNLNGEFYEGLAQLELLQSKGDFTKAMAQMSGGLHGYTVDISAINSRTLVNTMKNKALTRNYLTNRPLNSWYQDVVYLDNNHRLGGLMNSTYQEKGVLGISEKQVFSNARLGLVYGGSRGNAKFDGGNSGSINSDNIYIGLYYNHDLNEKLSLNTNFSFVYGHNNVTRNVKFGTVDYSFDSTYPTFAMGIGTRAIYTLKDTNRNKLSLYTGIDVNRIMQGNINEEAEKAGGLANELTVRNVPVNENSYYSITPSIGLIFQNSGYFLDKKYKLGADILWETEVGNIKDGKQINIQKPKDPNKDLGKLVKGYKVGTMERENIISTSIFGELDINDSLALNARYTSIMSDEQDTDMMTLGMTYKMDTMSDNLVFGPIFSGLENTRKVSDRWGGTFSLMLEAEDDSDRAYYKNGYLTSGDYATSMQMKPKFTLSLNDKKSKFSYYFEGYYKANNFMKETKGIEEKQKATRIHGEVRWVDSYSKGNYGLSIGYRNETANKPTLTTYPGATRAERGVHQLRITPSFSYNLGNNFIFSGKTTAIFEYNYTGLREGQMDFSHESEYGIGYTGFMPRWNLRVNLYRSDTWFDHDNTKLSWNKGYVYLPGAEEYQSTQLRPTVTYYFENGATFELAMRMAIGNGAYYNELNTGTKTGELYETRYSVKYTHPVVPGFSVFGGITFLDNKTKKKDHSNPAEYGDTFRTYSFRPTLGFNYSF